jgi:hypothetical protein
MTTQNVTISFNRSGSRHSLVLDAMEHAKNSLDVSSHSFDGTNDGMERFTISTSSDRVSQAVHDGLVAAFNDHGISGYSFDGTNKEQGPTFTFDHPGHNPEGSSRSVISYRVG